MQDERKLVLLLCVVAAIRVFVFAAAFPFFNNVDEENQFDSVIRYSRGEIPRRITTISPEAADSIATYESKEYVNREIQSPVWTMRTEESALVHREAKAVWQSRPNIEAKEPPLYYMVAGAWLNLARTLGVKGGALLYWIRFLNVPLFVALVWMGYAAARYVFPERPFLRVALPALVAVWPHDIFYSIESDVLSPVCGGIAFLILCRWTRDDMPGKGHALSAGLVMAAAALNKLANLPFVTATFLAAIWIAVRSIRNGKTKAGLLDLALFCAAVLVPISAWFLWNYFTVGELTATSQKIHYLGWTRKPISVWWPHPIFAPRNWWIFWSDTLSNFWRGEFFWKGKVLAFTSVDLFYSLSSLLLLAVATGTLLAKSKLITPAQRRVLSLALLWFMAGIAFLILVSLSFQFNPLSHPSTQYPFFTAARLISGMLIPFLLLYAYGLDRITDWINSMSVRWTILTIVAAVILVSDAILNWAAFSSPFNFFHIWKAGA